MIDGLYSCYSFLVPWLDLSFHDLGFHRLLGLELDDVLEGSEPIDVVRMVDRCNQIVDLPPLTETERATEREALAERRMAASRKLERQIYVDHWARVRSVAEIQEERAGPPRRQSSAPAEFRVLERLAIGPCRTAPCTVGDRVRSATVDALVARGLVGVAFRGPTAYGDTADFYGLTDAGRELLDRRGQHMGRKRRA